MAGIELGKDLVARFESNSAFSEGPVHNGTPIRVLTPSEEPSFRNPFLRQDDSYVPSHLSGRRLRLCVDGCRDLSERMAAFFADNPRKSHASVYHDGKILTVQTRTTSFEPLSVKGESNPLEPDFVATVNTYAPVKDGNLRIQGSPKVNETLEVKPDDPESAAGAPQLGLVSELLMKYGILFLREN